MMKDWMRSIIFVCNIISRLCFTAVYRGNPKRLQNIQGRLYLRGLHRSIRNCGFVWGILAGRGVKEAAAILLKYPNVYADTAFLYFDCAREFYKEVLEKEIPATWIDRSLRHQVMFGSNYPRFEQIRMAKALETLPFRESTIDLIKGQNALDFLNEKM